MFLPKCLQYGLIFSYVFKPLNPRLLCPPIMLCVPLVSGFPVTQIFCIPVASTVLLLYFVWKTSALKLFLKLGNLLVWSEQNHLQLNAKTKYWGVDMRRNRRTNENYFYWVCVQSLEDGKCHVQTDNKLDFIKKKKKNTETLFILFSEITEVLWHLLGDAQDFLWVCCGQCQSLFCCVLGL